MLKALTLVLLLASVPAGAPQGAQKPDSFTPSETLPADGAISFPTDI